MPNKTIAIVNTTGRQAASVARVAAAIGYHVRAHVNSKEGPVAQELQDLENVTILEGSLSDAKLVAQLFLGAQRAFVNTIPWGDEIAIGKSLADTAKQAGVQHYIYSSMPDHGIYGQGWPSLPMWSVKFSVENYVRQVSRPYDGVSLPQTHDNRSICPLPLCIREYTTIISLVYCTLCSV